MQFKVRDKLRFFSMMSLLVAVKQTKTTTKFLPYCGDCTAMFWIKDLWELLRQGSEYFFLLIPSHACPIVQATWRPVSIALPPYAEAHPTIVYGLLGFLHVLVFSCQWCLVQVVFLVFLNCIIENVVSNLSVKGQKTTALFSVF